MEREYKYKAFISYSHKDEKFAKWLHKKLEDYKIPKDLYEKYPNLPKKLYPIFRDIEELPTSSSLSQNIIDALKDSAYLIVICSPNSAKSQWVNKEILDFKTIHKDGEDRVLPIILSGEPNAKDRDDLDDNLECFPEALKYKVKNGKLTNERTEPIAADVREGMFDKEFGKLKLIAGLLGVDFEELNQREIKKQKQRRAFLVSGLLGVSGLAGVSIWKWIEVEEAKRIVIEKSKELNKENIRTKNLLYNTIMERGILYRDYQKKLVEAKLTFAKAISLSTNKTQEKQAKIAYENVNKGIKLYEFYEFPKKNGIIEMNMDTIKALEWNWNSKEIKLWNIKSNQLIHIFKDRSNIQGAIFNHNGKFILSWNKDNKIKVWDIKNNKLLHTFKDNSEIEEVISHPYKEYILSWNKDNKIKLWDIKNNKLLHTFKGDKNIKGLAFSSNGKKIVFWNKYEEKVKLIDINNYEVFTLKIKNLYHSMGIILNETEEYLLNYGGEFSVGMGVHDEDGFIDLWYMKDSKNLIKEYNLEFENYIANAIFINNKEIVSIDSQGKMEWRNISEDRLIKSFYTNSLYNIFQNNNYLYSFRDNIIKIIKTENIFFTLKHPDLKNLINNEKEILSWSDNEIKLWNKSTKKLVYTFKHLKVTEVISINDDNIISWGNHKIKLWSKVAGKLLYIFKHKNIKNIAIIKKEQELISWSNNEIKLWNIEKQRLTYTIFHKGIESILITKDKSKIISWNDNNIKIWNKENGELLKEFKPNFEDGIYIVELSPNEDEIIVADLFGRLKLWNINTNSLIFDIKSGYVNFLSIQFSDDNQRIIILGSYGTIAFIDKKSGNKVFELEQSESPIWGLKFLKDRMISWGRAGNIIIWNKNNGKALHYLSHRGSVRYVEIINEKEIMSYSNDGSIKLWNVNTGKLILTLAYKLYTLIDYVQLSKDKTEIFSWTENNFRIWDKQSGRILLNLDFENTINGIVVNKDEKEIVIWDKDKIRIYELYRKRKLSKDRYLLEAEVEMGSQLSKNGETKFLILKEWLKKKSEYDKILK